MLKKALLVLAIISLVFVTVGFAEENMTQEVASSSSNSATAVTSASSDSSGGGGTATTSSISNTSFGSSVATTAVTSSSTTTASGSGGGGSTAAITCVDSDGGINYYQKGTATTSSQSLSDHCNSDGTLTEKYCESDEIKWHSYTCPNGCENDACKPESATAIGYEKYCGDGKCQIGEDYNNCPSDCKNTVCPTISIPKCGENEYPVSAKDPKTGCKT